ncbi:MAG TPA: hypothetical protein VK848_05015 [Acidimicrobiia bacterium]|nr:hypothetical protein [Acidimicrobiia bacterium]
MRKRLTAPLLLAGHFLLTLTPVAAMAAPAQPAAGPPATGSYHALHDGCYDDGCRDPYDSGYDHYGDDHYRCMYHCQERYGFGYDRYRYDRYRYGHRDNRAYHNGQCWAHDDRGWHRCGYRDRYWSYEGSR